MDKLLTLMGSKGIERLRNTNDDSCLNVNLRSQFCLLWHIYHSILRLFLKPHFEDRPQQKCSKHRPTFKLQESERKITKKRPK